MEIIVDVRTREEYIKEHIKGAINIPLHDLHHSIDFLKGKEISLYCDSGRRASSAKELLAREGIDAKVIKPEEIKKYRKEKGSIICALNYVFIREGKEDEFEKNAFELCKEVELPGFLGGKLLKASGISSAGSSLKGDLSNEKIKPSKYIMITYWESKKAHEDAHKTDLFVKAFEKMKDYVAMIPYEEFYEILR
ncbi:MAG: antibiotic biosynthesis monooxygenase [Thermoplasmatales archaeon]|nr:antibiotic biosynthesis monooxygenase [Thermoplasmatales archaeon]